MESDKRVVVLIDMDCFYCQVEEKLNPELKGKPIAVVQYNPWKGGGIIAVNYEARAKGVTRHMRGDEAKAKCPEIELPSVPCSRGKADITKYRDAGKEVAKVLQRFTSLLERASIDEAYLDITVPVQERLKSININSITSDLMPNTFALGYDSISEFISDVHSCSSDNIDFDYEHAKMLVVGAVIVSEMRAAVYNDTGYRCSAGISHNKILAKLVCGMNKPNKQTILPKHSIDILYKNLLIKKVKHLGGKFGDIVCEALKISKMAELQNFSEKHLQKKFDDKNGTWLYNIARGIDLEPVQARFNPKSIGCCKQLRGKAALLDLECLKKWLTDLGHEIEDRLEKDGLENNRTPKQMVVSYSVQLPGARDSSSSRSYNFTAEDDLCGDLFSRKALELVIESSEGVKLSDKDKNIKLRAPITFLGVSVGKFEDNSDEKKIKKINDYFGADSSKSSNEKQRNVSTTQKHNSKQYTGKEYILQKYFQVSDEKIKPEVQKSTPDPPVLNSTLDKQESFFAKLLSRKLDGDTRSVESDSSVHYVTKPNTPVCEVINHGEDSNETDFSGSTINMEINKSIALFEDDPNNIERVDSMRNMLNKSTDNKPMDNEENVPPNATTPDLHPSQNVDTLICDICGKIISTDNAETHADYHYALKIRDEERKEFESQKSEVKKEMKVAPQKDKKKNKKDTQSDISETSITKFFSILDSTVPTEPCSECGKRIPVDSYAEHLDFHEAQKLNRELNKINVRPPSNKMHTKRKRTSASPVKKLKVPKCKSIESFFK